MKRFQKLMVFLCALAIVAVVSAPIINAEAATTKMNVSKKTIYVGGSKVNNSYSKGYYNLRVIHRAKKYSVTWESSNPSVATVEKLSYGKAKVVAVAPGEVVITAHYTDKVTKTTSDYSSTITVKKNCAAVDIAPASVEPMQPGTTTTLAATMYNADGSYALPGVGTTDVVRWSSSNTKVATVDASGHVKAVAPGKATITCYTVQAETGTYSKLKKATASDTVEITVEVPPVRGLVSAVQKSLNTFELTFAQDFSKTVTKDNLKITKSTGFAEVIKDMQFDATGLKATITTTAELADGITYSIELTGTDANTDLKTSFTAVKGYPDRIAFYTLNDNKVVVNEENNIFFKIYSGDIDITPLDVNSSEYITYKRSITFSMYTQNVHGYVISDSNGNGKLLMSAAGETATIKGVYKGTKTVGGIIYENELNGFVTVTSVTKASTLSFNIATDVLVTDSTDKSGEKLDWDKPTNRVAQGDLLSKVVVRVKGGDGKYIYSDDVASMLTLKTAAQTSTTKAYVDTKGSIYPIAQGTEVVTVLYENEKVGEFMLLVSEPRKAYSMTLTENGNRIPVSMVSVSNRSGVSKATLTITVKDQYDKVIPFSLITGVTCTPAANVTSPTCTVTANSDGTGKLEVDAAGYGGVSGAATYSYTLSFNDYNYGSSTASFVLRVVTPDILSASTYEVAVEGTTDMTLSSATTALPSMLVKVYEMKSGVKYSEVSSISAGSAPWPNAFYYKLYQDGSPVELTADWCSGPVINIVRTDVSGVLTKLNPGKYYVQVYQSGNLPNSLGQYLGSPVGAPVYFTLTDTQVSPVVEAISYPLTTSRKIYTGMSVAEMTNIFNECFKVTFGGNLAGASQISFPKDAEPLVLTNGTMVIRGVDVLESVTIGSTPYTLKHTVTGTYIITSTAK